MLFNSYEFIFIFLPITAAAFFALSKLRFVSSAAGSLALASIVFYGYWSLWFVPLLLGSVAFNFVLGRLILGRRQAKDERSAYLLLTLAVATNLLVLGYFKYTNFLVTSLDTLVGAHWQIAKIVLPIGISFFTFTQIAYLVDTFQGKVKESNPLHYLLFVTYFPHLIAGPVLHHKEMMPQFALPTTYRFDLRNFSIGVAFFLVGLFKKVILADGIQPFVGPVFDAPAHYTLSGMEAWGGALAYTLQLYFDFSGYSDMAIGLSKMFNVDLPLNFDSPYKSTNIIEFWRRWHMTLSRFLRDYLYIPLGGNRKGKVRRYLNLFTTMLLGGLWHGAGWTFVVWGALHGVYLAINHAWRSFREKILRHDMTESSRLGRIASVTVTFLVVVVGWVFFRAESIDSAMQILTAMLGLNGWAIPNEWRAALEAVCCTSPIEFADLSAFGGSYQIRWVISLLFVAFALPNSQTMILAAAAFIANSPTRRWSEPLAWSGLGSAFLLVVIIAAINASRGISEFIYFNF